MVASTGSAQSMLVSTWIASSRLPISTVCCTSKSVLQVKLAKADAAIGAGPVLPGVETGDGRVFADTREEIMKIWQGDTDILEDEGHHAALSGEEYRKRLRTSKDRTNHYAEIKRLPYGSGSGFVNPRIQQSGYVFCVRIGDHDRPWFRFVPTDDEWNPLTP